MRRATVAALGLALVLTVCSAGDPSSTLAVDLHEWGIEVSHPVVVAGPVTVDVANTGEFPHTLVVETAGGTVVTATDALLPGTAVQLDLDLAAGDYRFTCRIVAGTDDGTLVDHYEAGMLADIAAG